VSPVSANHVLRAYVYVCALIITRRGRSKVVSQRLKFELFGIERLGSTGARFLVHRLFCFIDLSRPELSIPILRVLVLKHFLNSVHQNNSMHTGFQLERWHQRLLPAKKQRETSYKCVRLPQISFKMPAVKGDGMRGLAVFISDIRNCVFACFTFVYQFFR
jgi:hypothetical protein